MVRNLLQLREFTSPCSERLHSKRDATARLKFAADRIVAVK